MAGLTNWAGNHAYVAANLHEPASIEQLQELVRNARSLRALGSRHSFNDVADTSGDLVSLDRMPRRFDLNRATRTVTVDGGVRYGELCGRLDEAGFALHNLASLPHISVAGACATATHGSGDRNGNLATAVAAMEIVTAGGEVAVIARDRDPDVFDGAVVALGGLGVVVALTLDVEPAFRMRQDVYEGLPLKAALERFDEITSSADSVSMFTNWRGSAVDQVWLKRRVADGEAFVQAPDFHGASIATVPLHPIRAMSPAACTEQLGIVGPSYERLPHFRMDHTPSSGAELQSEYMIPRRHAAAAMLAIDALRDQFEDLLQVSEVRTIAADRLWMSTAFGRASVAIHFTWQPDWERVRRVLPTIEEALAPFGPRPHWGKLFTMSPEAVRSSYDNLSRFAALLERFDPHGTFRNAFLDRYIFAG
jgi:xylitol oxidase